MHKCVRCGSVYEDNDSTILRGCASCGAIFFLYMKEPGDVTHLDAVERELQSRETTLERELAKQIERRKSESEVGVGAGMGVEEKIEAEVEKEVEREAKEAVAAKIEEVEFVRKTKAKRKAKRGKAKKAKGARKGPKLKIKIKAKRGVSGVRGVSVRKDVVTIGGKKFAVEDLFGIETIRVPKDGVYEINIDALMKNQPVIVLERGQIYIIHLPDVFESVGKK